MKQKTAVFLDRDGVINHAFVRDGKSYPPQTMGEFTLIAGVIEACEQLKAAGYLLIIVTNQPDVSTGKQEESVVCQMHDHLRKALPIDDIYVCYHVDADGCECRKPKPGMLVEAAKEYDIDLPHSFMVGDRWKDIDAGDACGCQTFFIDYNYKEKKPSNKACRVKNLLEASDIILDMA